MKKLLLSLLLVASVPAWAQLTDAHSLWKKQISSTAPTNGQCLVWVSATSKWTPSSCGAGGSPGGSNTQIQYNSSSSFGGAAGWTITNSGQTLTGGSSSILSTAAGKFLLPTANTAGSGISVTTVSGTSQIAFDSSVLAGAYFNLSGSNAVSAGTGNTCTPSATTGCLVLVGAARPSAPAAGSLNVNLSGLLEWYTGAAWRASGPVASGAKALATGAISSAACTSAQTDTATGTLTTDTVVASFNGDPTGVTGYVPLTAGMLTIIAYPTADTVNFKVCNNTTGSITPGAITLNWRVVR